MSELEDKYNRMADRAWRMGELQATNEKRDDTYLGIERGKGKGIYLPEDSRKTHMHVIGGTGTGKSKFLEHIIRQDIDRGNGLCLIDPHGSLYWETLRYCIDKGALERVIPFNPAEPDYVIGFNPIRRKSRDISYQVGRMCEACLKVWKQENSTDTPRLRRWLHRVFYVLSEADLTLSEAKYLISFSKNDPRKAIVEKLKESQVKEDFLRLESLKGPLASSKIREELESVNNRIDSFINSQAIRQIFGQQKQVIELRKIIDEGKILLVNLSEQKTLSKDQLNLIGILLVNEMISSAYAREDIPEEKRRPFYLYIDEFQRFITRDIAIALEEMRKFGLHLILSHQHLGQLQREEEYVFSSIMTNARTKVVFGGLSHQDVEYMSKEIFFGEFDPEQVKLELKRTYYELEDAEREIRSYGKSSGKGVASGQFSSSVIGSGESETLIPAMFIPTPLTTSESISRSSGSGSSEIDSSFYGESESVSIVPWIKHIKAQETSSIQYRSLEEQLYVKAALMKDQETQNALVKMPGQRVISIKIPFVEETKAGKHSEKLFLKRIFKSMGILSREEVNYEIQEREKRLEERTEEKSPNFKGKLKLNEKS